MPQKKSFKDNPALQFISTQSIDVPVKQNPIYIETRSKRLNLLIQPSLHKELKNIATAQDMSLNELIHNVLEQYIKNR